MTFGSILTVDNGELIVSGMSDIDDRKTIIRSIRRLNKNGRKKSDGRRWKIVKKGVKWTRTGEKEETKWFVFDRKNTEQYHVFKDHTAGEGEQKWKVEKI